ncbi:S8 family serine peptidase [Cohnella sp. GCM10027633]|uniref:S8 family peptidase n=1 Tax=unclassified Cohnella TaxID=2636738 RepID=UPI003638E792
MRKLGLALLILIVALSSVNASAGSYDDYRYFLPSTKVPDAGKLLSGQRLSKTLIVNLDSGISERYFDVNRDRTIYQAWRLSRYPAPWDDFGHGTKVQYVIDAVLASSGISDEKGVSPVQTITYKMNDHRGKSTANGLIEALNDIIDNFVVKNGWPVAAVNFSSSLSFNLKVPGAKEERRRLQDALNRLREHGVTFVTASGNENGPISADLQLMSNVIVVGATDRSNDRGTWKDDAGNRLGSNYGPNLDLVAPGVDVMIGERRQSYRWGNGTSYAAPQVTAAIALMRALNPKLTPDRIESLLKTSAKDLGAKKRDDMYGYGLLDAKKTLGSVISGLNDQ